MAIIRGTTPTITFHVKDESFDMTEIAEVWVTFKTKAGVKIKEKNYTIEDLVIDAENHTIELDLTQEDTLDLPDTNVNVQLRVRTDSELAYASQIIEVEIGHILKDGVI